MPPGAAFRAFPPIQTTAEKLPGLDGLAPLGKLILRSVIWSGTKTVMLSHLGVGTYRLALAHYVNSRIYNLRMNMRMSSTAPSFICRKRNTVLRLTPGWSHLGIGALVYLCGVHGAQRVGGEVAKQAGRPVHVLQVTEHESQIMLWCSTGRLRSVRQVALCQAGCALSGRLRSVRQVDVVWLRAGYDKKIGRLIGHSR